MQILLWRSATALLGVDNPVLHPMLVFAGRVGSPEGDDNGVFLLGVGETHSEARAFRVFDKPRLWLVAVELRGERKFRELVWRKRAVAFGKGWMAAVGGSGVFTYRDEEFLPVLVEIVPEGHNFRSRPGDS